MENHGLGTHNDKICAKSSTENTSSIIPHNLFGQSAQIAQSFGTFLKKPSSHVHDKKDYFWMIIYKKQTQWPSQIAPD